MNVTPLWDAMFMDTNTARRVRREVRDGLASLIRFVNDADTATADVREVLAESKALAAQVSVLQSDSAVTVASRERHGDGGVGVLARSAGLFKKDAASQVNTVEKLGEMPGVRDALESGEISVANAKTLASASDKTSVDQVEQDSELLAMAADLAPERFAQEAGRWVAKRQADDGEERYRRQRARRRLRFWDGDDGMVHLRGELDPVTGAKVRKRFSQEAERLRRADLHSAGGDKRDLNQRTADALDTLTAHGSIYARSEARNRARNSAAGKPNSAGRDAGAGRTGSGSDGDTGDPIDSGGGGAAGILAGIIGVDGSGADSDRGVGGAGGAAGLGGDSVGGAADRGGGAGDAADSRSVGRCGCGRRPAADITIVQHLSADGTDAFAEIAGGDAIPQSVLEEYFCDARITGVVFSSEGVPLWHGHAKRVATKAQMNALRARYGLAGAAAPTCGSVRDITSRRCPRAGLPISTT